MRATFAAALAVAVLLPGTHAVAQNGDARPRVPFGVGETMTYRLHARWFLVSGSGTASLTVEDVDTLRSNPAYRLAFRMKGGITVLKVDDVQRSWLDTDEFFSHRFEQKLNQTGYQRDRTYDFFPGTMRYERLGVPEDTGRLDSPRPLDDVSFLYHVRMLPLEVGRTLTEQRYYKAEGNPVTVHVLRRERIRVPAGEFDAIVVRPVIRTDGLFKEGGEAEVWLSDDDRRILLRLKAKVSIATLTMELQSYTPPTQGNGQD